MLITQSVRGLSLCTVELKLLDLGLAAQFYLVRAAYAWASAGRGGLARSKFWYKCVI